MKCTRKNFLRVSILSLLTFPDWLKSRTATNQTVVSSAPNGLESKPVDHSLLLHCIALVESEDDDTKIGPKGERSRYQISEAVWYQHTTTSIDIPSSGPGVWPRRRISGEWFDTCKGKRADQVALEHITWLNGSIPFVSDTEKHFREYCLAWTWHGGLDSWLHPKDSDRIRLNNYAVRVTNLYDDLKLKWPKQSQTNSQP